MLPLAAGIYSYVVKSMKIKMKLYKTFFLGELCLEVLI